MSKQECKNYCFCDKCRKKREEEEKQHEEQVKSEEGIIHQLVTGGWTDWF